MNTYHFAGQDLDSIDLKCLLTSKGVIADPEIYDTFEPTCRVSRNVMHGSSLILSDGLACSFNDVGVFMDQIGGRYQWTEDEKKSYNPQLQTPFNVKVIDGKAALLFHDEFIDFVSFPPAVDFYDRTTKNGTPFAGNMSIQGMDFGTFAYLWPCEYAATGKVCQYCHSGNATCRAAQRGEKLGGCFSIEDSAEMLKWGVEHAGVRSLMATGGSTFEGKNEFKYYEQYLMAWNEALGGHIPADMVFYLTPPKDLSMIDRYIELGADKLGISIEVWNEDAARIVTPGKMEITTRQRHIDAWDYTVKKFGSNYVFTNFILGLEDFEDLEKGVRFAADRGVFPGGSVWVPMGTEVNGKMVPPGIDFYKRCKELWFEIFDKYEFVPSASMANGDIEPDVYRILKFGDFREWKNVD
jgi:hypothetical protein